MARPTETDVDYRKYLDSAEPTALMEHVEEWIRDKAAVDPTKFKTKAEAFAYGVFLTVHLRMAHQASPENQERLKENRKAKADADTAKENRRAERAATGAKPRGRMPKAKADDETATPKKTAARKPRAKASTETAPEAPKRRTRKAPAKAAADEAPSNVTELPTARRRRGRPAATAVTETSPAVGAASEPAAKPVRRRAARRGEAAF